MAVLRDHKGTGARGIVARSRRRRTVHGTSMILVLAVICLVIFCVSLSVGDVRVPPADVARTVIGTGDGDADFIINRLRLPRALVAVMSGAAFGLAGAIFQALIRNPLASPDIIGINAGASAAAVIAILLLGLDGHAVSFAAFAGALGIAGTIYTLAWRDGITGYRLVLVGIAMAAIMTSVVSYFLTRSDVYSAQEALVWITGSLNAKTWTTVQILAPSLALLIPLGLLAGRRLTALQLGDDAARALGVPAERTRLALLLVAAALAAVATAAAGPVAFVAFVSGPIARHLVGNTGAALVAAGVIGASIMTMSDVVAQHAFGSIELPVGVVTAIVGAPYLLWLLASTNRAGHGG